MNATQFREAMEAHAKKMNIPLRDVLADIDEIGHIVMQKPEGDREAFMYYIFIKYCAGFPEPLPLGTKSIRQRYAEAEEDEN